MIVRIEPYGALVYSKRRAVTVRMNKCEAKRYLSYEGSFPNDLTAPEIVHLEISNRCTKDCGYCYVEKKGDELPTEKWKGIIEDLAENRVLQVTFGGGEPFLRDDLYELALYADDIGMNTAVTTNGDPLEPSFKVSVFRQVNFSVHGNLGELKPKILATQDFTEVGINFVLKEEYEGLLEPTAEFCRENDVELLLLSYKPVNGDEREAIAPQEVYRRAESLADKGAPVAVDGMTCHKCMAARRFVDVDSEGNVTPCSFVREPIGNLLESSFSEIWAGREVPQSCPYRIA
ncbi:hypothetical protein AKJ61_00755 [candidate division MSBL1 archaeon SCGC-AAA259B11]|uniref:Radical SAM core domain-containing protein n=1 Tax=candidate division MSBL1 archaeon SCGC-AAA259B11 TaxID=1698260 RepID=A0A133U845_9EURY|nr:hypothetical protein AKJ61_00755 [candidate division MSBL1 archaeon SCGC-AAA259B11]